MSDNLRLNASIAVTVRQSPGSVETAARPPSRWRFLIAFLLLALVLQLVSWSLNQPRSAQPPTLFSSAEIFADDRAPTLGPRTADVTIYLLSDYACSNCRAMHADLRRLVAEDQNVRIVYRDLPILGGQSTRAARLAIASASLGQHSQFDNELMRRGGSLDEASLRAVAARADVDWRDLTKVATTDASRIDSLIADTRLKARGALQALGTPVLIIGPFLVQGRQSYDRLQYLVSEARTGSAGSSSRDADQNAN